MNLRLFHSRCVNAKLLSLLSLPSLLPAVRTRSPSVLHRSRSLTTDSLLLLEFLVRSSLLTLDSGLVSAPLHSRGSFYLLLSVSLFRFFFTFCFSLLFQQQFELLSHSLHIYLCCTFWNTFSLVWLLPFFFSFGSFGCSLHHPLSKLSTLALHTVYIYCIHTCTYILRMMTSHI